MLMFKRKPKRRELVKKRSIIPGVLKKIAITILVLVMLAGIAGVIYTYLNGRKEPPLLQNDAITKEVPKITHTLPAENAKEGVALVMLTSPVKAGENATMSVRTNARSKCLIEVKYGAVASKDSGLTPKYADDFGSASWTWTVEPTVPAGKHDATVTCVYNGRSGVYAAHFEVQR